MNSVASVISFKKKYSRHTKCTDIIFRINDGNASFTRCVVWHCRYPPSVKHASKLRHLVAYDRTDKTKDDVEAVEHSSCYLVIKTEQFFQDIMMSTSECVGS